MTAIMKRPAAARAATLQKEPPQGTVSLTFDAGGQSNEVNPNPVSPRQTQDGSFELEWRLRRKKNMAPGWEVQIANVVLCAELAAPAGFQSMRGAEGQSWTWKFAENFPERQGIQYELFYLYFPTNQGGSSDEAALRESARNVCLSEIIVVDPTIFPQPPGG